MDCSVKGAQEVHKSHIRHQIPATGWLAWMANEGEFMVLRFPQRAELEAERVTALPPEPRNGSFAVQVLGSERQSEKP